MERNYKDTAHQNGSEILDMIYCFVFFLDVSTLCDRCPHLQELDLSDSTEITNLAADEIGSKLNELQSVSLSRCYNISPSAFL